MDHIGSGVEAGTVGLGTILCFLDVRFRGGRSPAAQATRAVLCFLDWLAGILCRRRTWLRMIARGAGEKRRLSSSALPGRDVEVRTRTTRDVNPDAAMDRRKRRQIAAVHESTCGDFHFRASGASIE
jgi:hypothetical protein